MESLIEVVKIWKKRAIEKKQQSVSIGDSHEANFQLGKIEICDDFIKQLNEEIEKEKTSKERNTQGTQSPKEDTRQQYDSV